jgi:hypothetical protein
MRNADADGPNNRARSEPPFTAFRTEQDERLPAVLYVIGAICVILGILIGGATLGVVGYGLGYALGAAIGAAVGGGSPADAIAAAGWTFGATIGIILGVDIGGGAGLYLTPFANGSDTMALRAALWSPTGRRVLRMVSGGAVGAISGFIGFGAVGGALAAVGGAAIGSVLSADVGS